MSVSVSLYDVLRVCVRSALAAQQYIALELLKLSQLPVSDAEGGRGASSILDLDDSQKQRLLQSLSESVAVEVKAELNYKEGEASHDLVTTADVLTQAVVVKALSTAFPDLPFTIVGEEESGAVENDAEMAARMRHCLQTYYCAELKIPCEDMLSEHLAKQTSAAAKGVLTADSINALRERVSLYIDPIDGTNCFVTGVWQSPMTLVGITVDGEPVAAVMNRVFLYPIGRGAAPGAGAVSGHPSHRPPPPCDSVSYVWNGSPRIAGSAFMVHEGRHVPLPTATAPPPPPRLPLARAGDDEVLCVIQSSTTKVSFLADVAEKLKPSSTVLARGAGNKLFALVEKELANLCGVSQRRHGAPVHADVFICPGNTIKKWDTCGPQAFLCALGGDVYNCGGVPLRYPFQRGDDPHASAFTDLPDAIVAVRKEARPAVARRLDWDASHY